MLNGTPNGQPACSSDGWRYSFDGVTSEGKNILSLPLAAQTAKQTVMMGGRGACTLSPNSEDIRHVYIVTT